MKHKRSTQNKFICWLIGWFYESHSAWPRQVFRVYGLKEYFTRDGRHVYVEEFSFWHSFYRATGMVFPACKKAWDKLEDKLWPKPASAPEHYRGM